MNKRELDNHRLEAETLNSMGAVYKDLGELQEALSCFERALSIHHEVGNPRGEAIALNNMGVIYLVIGQPEQALVSFKQALPVMQKLGDRRGEAVTLSNMATVLYQMLGQPEQALALFQQSLLIAREIGNHSGEIGTLCNMADALYHYLDRPKEAIGLMEQAIALLIATGLPQDAAGQSVVSLQQLLKGMCAGAPFDTATGGSFSLDVTFDTELADAFNRTRALLYAAPEQRAAWRRSLAQMRRQAIMMNKSPEIIKMLGVLIGMMDGKIRFS